MSRQLYKSNKKNKDLRFHCYSRICSSMDHKVALLEHREHNLGIEEETIIQNLAINNFG